MLLCELDGRVLGGMQFGVLVDVLLCGCYGACSLGRWWVLAGLRAGRRGRPGARGHAVSGAGGCCFASLTAGCWGHAVWGAWWMLFCFSSWPGARGMQFGALVDAVLRGCCGDAVWAAVDAVLRAGRVLGGMQFGALVAAVLRA